MLKCNFCGTLYNKIQDLVSHCRFHAYKKICRFKCPTEFCKVTFKSYATFKAHVYKAHVPQRASTVISTAEKDKYNCNVPSCEKKVNNYKELVAHMKCHLNEGKVIECPHRGCIKKFKVKSTFASHLSRNHCNQIMEGKSTSAAIGAPSETVNRPGSMIKSSHDIEIPPEVQIDEHSTVSSDEHQGNFDESEFIMMFNLFLVKLQVEHHVSQVVINEIVKAFKNFHDLNNEKILLQILNIIHSAKPDFEGDHELLKIFNADLLDRTINETSGVLRSTHTRVQYVKANMKFVEPVEVKFSCFRKQDFCHYIPILESLKNFLSDPSVMSQMLDSKHTMRENVLNDVQDGYVYKNNAFFNTSDKKIELVLYQDSFEVVNPLGSAKMKHKLVGVYFNIANMPAHRRSNVNSFQLVMLVKESVLKHHGSSIIFKPLVDELQRLRTDGIQISGDCNIKGNLLMILGDNLGSHYIGGFTESFMATHFCRYCTISQTEFRNDGVAKSSIRTSETYNADAMIAERDDCLSNGVKFSSVFNTLTEFHVATPSLPPCIAHDLFEGVVSYDLLLFLKYFCSGKKWASSEEVNAQILNFKFQCSDALDRPPAVNFKADSFATKFKFYIIPIY